METPQARPCLPREAINARFEVFSGQVTTVEARVYARLWHDLPESDTAIRGVLRGPRSHYARTLVSEFQFQVRERGREPLSEAIIPDPSSWTLEMAHCYEVELEATDRGQTIAAYNGILGVRRWGARGANLMLEGRRWVVRAAHRVSVSASSLDDWRRERMAMMVAEAPDALCEAATIHGVMLLVDLSMEAEGMSQSGIIEEIHRLARWPAVLMVILSSATISTLGPKWMKPEGAVMIERVRESGWVADTSWIDGYIVDEESISAIDAIRQDAWPILVGQQRGMMSLAEARSACDELQRKLSPRGFAGYVKL